MDPLLRSPANPANVTGAARVGQNGQMTTWKPHALAKPHTDQLDLSNGDWVAATADLPGVAAGTEGKVILSNGFNWMRYRVQFTNGVELGDLDHRHLTPARRTAKRFAKAAKRA
jgi:hypothetical protein